MFHIEIKKIRFKNNYLELKYQILYQISFLNLNRTFHIQVKTLKLKINF
jgi:hypothetical protein